MTLSLLLGEKMKQSDMMLLSELHESFLEESKERDKLINQDVVNNPQHYKGKKFEVIDIIEDYKLGFNLGNLIKYVLRAGKKDPTKELEDLRKARYYLEREINKLEGKLD